MYLNIIQLNFDSISIANKFILDSFLTGTTTLKYFISLVSELEMFLTIINLIYFSKIVNDKKYWDLSHLPSNAIKSTEALVLESTL